VVHYQWKIWLEYLRLEDYLNYKTPITQRHQRRRNRVLEEVGEAKLSPAEELLVHIRDEKNKLIFAHLVY